MNKKKRSDNGRRRPKPPTEIHCEPEQTVTVPVHIVSGGRRRIIVQLSNGRIDHVEGIPEDVEVEVHDYDNTPVDHEGRYVYSVSIWGHKA